MVIGTTDGETLVKEGGDVCDAQGRGGQDAAANGGASVLDLTGNMAVCRLVGGTSEDREIKR